MVLLILMLFLAVEIAGVWLVGDLIGSHLLAIWLAVATTLAGLSLLRRAQAAWSPDALMRSLAGDRTRGLLDLIAPIAGAALLVVPGFVTDLLGLVLLVPATRGLLAAPLRKAVFAGLRRAMGGGLPGMGHGFSGAGEPPGFEALRRQWEELSGGARGGDASRERRREEGRIKDAEFTVRD